jgi:hypothetical protein
MLMCKIVLKRIVCLLKKRNKGIGSKIFLNAFFVCFCRQYLPDSTIPQGLAKQADVAFCFMPGA